MATAQDSSDDSSDDVISGETDSPRIKCDRYGFTGGEPFPTPDR